MNIVMLPPDPLDAKIQAILDEAALDDELFGNLPDAWPEPTDEDRAFVARHGHRLATPAPMTASQ